MSITNALAKLSTHRDVVPAYYVRATGQWIVTGLNKTSGGAAVVADDGKVVAIHGCKRDALRSISTN